ncbi:hypothetical protein BDZ45DRAFT_420603 [Acephala macrosclerotiorum]|nr:hypothetical protein BDZ45DRAFT_420603 [Acephala macrosclerotiorum]
MRPVPSGERLIEDFPNRPITAGCTHDPTICLCCLSAYIDKTLATDEIGPEPLDGCLECWAANNVRQLEERIKCPENSCGLQLTPRDITAFASEPEFELVDTVLPCGFPERPITDPCSTDCREAPPCLEYLSRSIKSDLDAGKFGRILCSRCPSPLGFEDIQKFAAKDVILRYDTFYTRKALEADPRFRWCQNPAGCPSGQVHETQDPLLTCHACMFAMCYQHERRWHVRMSCENFDIRQGEQDEETKASIETIATTHKCPACNVNIEK